MRRFSASSDPRRSINVIVAVVDDDIIVIIIEYNIGTF